MLLNPALTLDFVNACSHGYLSLCQLLLAALNLLLRPVHEPTGAIQGEDNSSAGLGEMQSDGMSVPPPCRCLAELDLILRKNSSINRTSCWDLWLQAGV